jgi:ankyrin repeat protein
MGKMTALHEAVQHGRPDCLLEPIKDSPGSVDLLDSNGRSSLQLSFLWRNHGLVKLLLEHGANHRVFDHKDFILLMLLILGAKAEEEESTVLLARTLVEILPTTSLLRRMSLEKLRYTRL